MSCYESQASGQSKEALEEKLFYAFPAAKSSNISSGSDVFILEFLPQRDNRTLLFQLSKEYCKQFAPNTNATFDLLLLSLSKVFFLTIVRIIDEFR